MWLGESRGTHRSVSVPVRRTRLLRQADGVSLCYEGSDDPCFSGADTMIDQWLEYTEWPGIDGSPSYWRLAIGTTGVDVLQTLSRY